MKKDIGKILMTYEGEYDNTRTYEPLCIVSYNKFKWISKKQTTGNPPSEEDTINWKLFMDDISASDLFSGNNEAESQILIAFITIVVVIKMREAYFKKLSRTDSLTHIYNKQYFQ